MPLNTKTFQQFVDDFINQFATETGIDPVVGPGSPLYGLAEANAGMASFLQFQAQYDTFFARSTTSTGPDLDSWMAQFNFPRLGATFAEGQVTLSLASPASSQIVVPAADALTNTGGVIVQTVGGGSQYQLVADTNQPNYNVGLNAYVLLVGQTSMTATAVALVGGSASNVLSGQLIQFSGSSYGITTVTNLAPIDNGTDSESDNAFRNRFILYINSLSKGTYQAILEACETAFDSFTYTLIANTNPELQTIFGFFTVIANNPGQVVSSGELAVLQTAINLVRAFTIEFAVIAPTIQKPPIVANISVANPANLTVAETAAQTAAIGLVNSLLPGQKLYLTNLIDAIENSSSFITSVEFSSVTIDGSQLDFTPTDIFHIIQADVSTVSIGEYSG